MADDDFMDEPSESFVNYTTAAIEILPTSLTSEASGSDDSPQKRGGRLKKDDNEEAQPQEDVPPVVFQVNVTDENLARNMKKVGIHLAYYCRKCIYYSAELKEVLDHVQKCRKRASVSQEQAHEKLLGEVGKTLPGGWNDESKPDDNDDLEDSQNTEHSYANDDDICDSADTTNIFTNVPRRFCSLCTITKFYSDKDLEFHQRCHGKSGKDRLACFFCKQTNPEEMDVRDNLWYRLRVHLSRDHNVDFELSCEVCNETFDRHPDYFNHRSDAHRHRCKISWCKFSSLNACDVETHEKCHVIDEKSYKCYLCNHVTKHDPQKWHAMHDHLVSAHPGSIEPLYRCHKCAKGFRLLRKHQNHVKTCGVPVPKEKKDQRTPVKGIKSSSPSPVKMTGILDIRPTSTTIIESTSPSALSSPTALSSPPRKKKKVPTATLR